jgi:hypothetical protein
MQLPHASSSAIFVLLLPTVVACVPAASPREQHQESKTLSFLDIVESDDGAVIRLGAADGLCVAASCFANVDVKSEADFGGWQRIGDMSVCMECRSAGAGILNCTIERKSTTKAAVEYRRSASLDDGRTAHLFSWKRAAEYVRVSSASNCGHAHLARERLGDAALQNDQRDRLAKVLAKWEAESGELDAGSGQPNERPPAAPESYSVSRAEATAAGRKIVLAQLKDPETASFKEEAVLAICPSGIAATVHVVRAQNSFGAFGQTSMCTLFNLATRTTTLQPNLCDSIEYTASKMSTQEFCLHWTKIMQNAAYTGRHF